MSIIKSGKLWPFAIGLAITLVFLMGVGTVIVTSKANIQESDAYMTNYQNADIKANDYIKARIAFDKKYKLKYITEQIKENGVDVVYSLTTKDGKPVAGAEMLLAISRPDTHDFDKKIDNVSFENGVYVFHNVQFPKKGAWNLLVKVKVGKNERFYEVKTDTRSEHARKIREASTY
jgi:nitrogen fixation protein FixH